MGRRVKRFFLLFLVALAVASPPALAERPRMTAEEAYALGLRYLKRGYYVKALEQLNRVRTYYRDDPYALKAELAIADVHYSKNEWDDARLAYEDFMHAHPRYRYLDYVVYRLGLTLYKKAPAIAARDQTWTRQAVNTWTGFSSRFPDSPCKPEVARLLEKARDRLARKELLIARFYDRREAWVSVIGRLDPMVKMYPESPDRAEALEMLSTAYHGIGRDDLAQQESDELAKLKAAPPTPTPEDAAAVGQCEAAQTK
jgi:outer membrane protein assembly factor BamD